MLKEVRKQVI